MHSSDGLCFERLPDGGVAVEKRNSAKADSGVQSRVELDADTWASVVASVCALGESRETRELAEVLHDLTDAPELEEVERAAGGETAWSPGE